MEAANACSKVWRNTSSFLIKDDQNSRKLKDCFGVLLGEGDRILFWNHEWNEGHMLKLSFPRIFSLAVKKDGLINEYGVWEDDVWKWKIDLRRSLFGWETEQWNNFMLLINQNTPTRGKSDRLIWKPNNNGIFSVRSAKQEVRNVHSDNEQVWKKLWRGLVPPKVEIFLWQLIKERIPVRKALLDRGIIESENARCAFCNNEVETVFHLFFKCATVWEIWMTICKRWGITWTFPGTVKQAFLSWIDFKVEYNLQCSWRTLFFASCWSIWLHRNLKIFEGKNMDISMVGDLIIIRAMQWFKAKSPHSTATVREALQDPKALTTMLKVKAAITAKWTRPATGMVKINVDAAVNVENGTAGIGGLLRDAQGKTKMVFSKPIECMRVEEAEFMAIWEAFTIYDQSSIANADMTLIIESDSSVACNWCSDIRRIPWRMNSIATKFELLKQKHRETIFCKVPRGINNVADNLAKAGSSRAQAMLVWL